MTCFKLKLFLITLTQLKIKNNYEIVKNNGNIGGLNFKISYNDNHDAVSITLDNFIDINNIDNIFNWYIFFFVI